VAIAKLAFEPFTVK